VKKILALVALVVAVLALVGAGVDRAAASVLSNTIASKVAEAVPGTGAVTSEVHGVPLLTQAARGSLEHVTVHLTDVPAGSGLTLDSVVVELYGVSTSSPRTAERVEAVATLGDDALAAKLGDGWKVRGDGSSLVVSSTGGHAVEARVTPTVTGGKVGFTLESVSILGVTINGDSVPQFVKDRIDALAGSLGPLPLGLTLTSVTVTPSGVELRATGSAVSLETVA
jgi:hypothetical protein